MIQRHYCRRDEASRPNQRRRGAVMVVALVCLLIVVGIIGNMLRGALRDRRALLAERDLRETELILQAGVDRAAYRLAGDPDYHGETWRPTAEQILGRGAGEVTIETSREAADKPWQIRVVAEYPLGGELSVRRSRTLLIPSP